MPFSKASSSFFAIKQTAYKTAFNTAQSLMPQGITPASYKKILAIIERLRDDQETQTGILTQLLNSIIGLVDKKISKEKYEEILNQLLPELLLTLSGDNESEQHYLACLVTATLFTATLGFILAVKDPGDILPIICLSFIMLMGANQHFSNNPSCLFLQNTLVKIEPAAPIVEDEKIAELPADSP